MGEELKIYLLGEDRRQTFLNLEDMTPSSGVYEPH